MTSPDRSLSAPRAAPIVMPSDAGDIGPLVLVTGASGFLGAHCVQQLLEAGYRVRGTLRSLNDEQKNAHVRALGGASGGGRLELAQADLLHPQSWRDAVAGCDYVLHVASPFPAAIPDDSDIVIRPAVDGTLNVLRAIASDKGRTVKRVVLTSSIAALFAGRDQMQKVWDEYDWGTLNDPAKPVDPYPASKLMAELAAWEFVAELPIERRFELATVCAGLMCGPYLGGVPGTSAETTMRLLKRQMPAVPNMIFPGVDVRDIARMHIRAMTAPDAAEQRFIGVAFDFAAREVAELLFEEFGPLGYRVTRAPMPGWLFKILSVFDSSLRAIQVHIGQRPTFDISPAEQKLGMTKWIGVRQSCIEQAYSLIENGAVPDLRKTGTQSVAFAPNAYPAQAQGELS
ncbi:aldehyde reductase [Novosphingobium sp.]|uniref:SDR family oxidoreductase n=1 Tax=Novosphingobium sp. TaxID=1874826 RepID=UPI0025F88410|nr:aldehyde reductase [Novosphingobium sp.]